MACTNSKGLMWKSADGSEGSFRNNEQKAAAINPNPNPNPYPNPNLNPNPKP